MMREIDKYYSGPNEDENDRNRIQLRKSIFYDIDKRVQKLEYLEEKEYKDNTLEDWINLVNEKLYDSTCILGSDEAPRMHLKTAAAILIAAVEASELYNGFK